MTAAPPTPTGTRPPGNDLEVPKASWLLVLALVVVGALLRLRYLNQPMRYDESVTYLYFAAKPWTTIVSSYLYPNNHVFHTLLVKTAVSVFGNEPWVIRVPALLAGIAMIPFTFVVARRLIGVTAAYVATALVAASGALTLYSTNARGYTFVCLATLILLELLLRLRERPSITAWAGVVITVALGMWTIPVMLYPAGGLALWFAISAGLGDTSDRNGDLRRIAIAVGASTVLTAILYAPILTRSGVAPLTGNQFVTASPWHVFFPELVVSIGNVAGSWRLGLPVIVALAAGVAVCIGLASARMTTRTRATIAGCVYLWCAVLLMVAHRTPFPRVWLFLLAPAAMLAGLGVFRVLSRWPKLVRGLHSAGGEEAIVLAVVLAAVVVRSRSVIASRDTGTLREAQQITGTLAPLLRRGDRVIAPVPGNAPLQYYFLRAGLDTAYLSATPAATSSVYLIVNLGEGFTIDTPIGEPLMREYRQAELIGRSGSAEVYRLVRPPSSE
jgi:hypothetical protein